MTAPAEPIEPVGPETFRSLLRQQAASVAVVTAAGAPPVGFTATSFTSVSLQPPLVSFCLARSSSSWPAVAGAAHVAVHLLGEDQRDIARTFATSGIDRFTASPGWRNGPYGVPLLPGPIAWLLCRVTQRVPAGDHVIVLAEPLTGQQTGGAPLLYHRGRYTGLRPPTQPTEGGTGAVGLPSPP
ncbi:MULTISPECIES: flavin reductase family protein [Micromonospora]|uniref:NADH-FMN oxidoreductase RutF, flavin reductase (DIM6/NTAB) family n=1 Tax=Micromonospora yangpuensis TaxID=683228 RepID=A0A1C6UM57_9ACTN|nr:flavin reductase family protein [Micromonospora yangpuensis]GGM18239.1 flavin-dependent reductase [Micromonospora yangpuensis]SCL55068.1 NADH-FMN oxidoreductase RutF, flavin reductase (DIM6/NTAB) family [Micromonospora yangpuensis]